jgi:hypothetical protein
LPWALSFLVMPLSLIISTWEKNVLISYRGTLNTYEHRLQGCKLGQLPPKNCG